MVVSQGKLRIVTPSAGTRSYPMTGLFCRNNLGQGAEFFSLSPVEFDSKLCDFGYILTYLPSLCFCLLL